MNGISLPAMSWGSNYAPLKGLTVDGILKNLSNNSAISGPLSTMKEELGHVMETFQTKLPQFVTMNMTTGFANNAIQTVTDDKEEKKSEQQQAAQQQQQRRRQGLMSPGMGPGMGGPSFNGSTEN